MERDLGRSCASAHPACALLLVALVGTGGHAQDELVTRAIAAVKPAVVYIIAQDAAREPLGSGTGFIVDRDGFVVTNAHVVEDAAKITVVINDKDEFSAQVVGVDEDHDLALLKLPVKVPRCVTFDSAGVKEGASVLWGHPLTARRAQDLLAAAAHLRSRGDLDGRLVLIANGVSASLVALLTASLSDDFAGVTISGLPDSLVDLYDAGVPAEAAVWNLLRAADLPQLRSLLDCPLRSPPGEAGALADWVRAALSRERQPETPDPKPEARNPKVETAFTFRRRHP